MEMMASTSDYEDNGWVRDYHTPRHPTWHAVLANILMVVLFPVALVTSLILIVMVFRDKKMRTEPWRWLIAHTSLCISVTTFFKFTNGLTLAYQLQSFETSEVCPGTKFLELVFLQMSTISFTLVMIERFCAMRSDNWKSGGFGKKGVIIPLAVFWVIAIVFNIISLTAFKVHGRDVLQYEEVNHGTICIIADTTLSMIVDLIVVLWVLISAIVTLVGSCVYGCLTSCADLKSNVINPTVTTTVFFALLYVSCFAMELIMPDFLFHYELFGEMYLDTIGLAITWIVFSLTWIITWTKNGDIHWEKHSPCCLGKADEEMHLVQTG